MKSLHASDTHLNFRAYSALIEGRNAREVDVERAWQRLVDISVEERPDLVALAGDIFHHPRPGFRAVKAYRDGIRRIIEDTRARVIILQGNHDAVKTADALSPIWIPDDYDRVYIITEPQRVRMETAEGEKISVACFPFVGLGEPQTYRLRPEEDADINILLMHAAVKSSEAEGALPFFYQGPHALDVGREAERWDIIALGDYHEFTPLHPFRPVFYSGSIERTSSNIWVEHEPKGVVVCETGSEPDMMTVYRFREIETRPMQDYDLGDFDLPPGASAEEVNGALREALTYDTTKDAIVRLKVDSFPRGQRDEIDWTLVRELKAHCLHFQLNLRFAEGAAVELGDRRERGAKTLVQEAQEFFAEDENEVRECALRYLTAGDPEAEEEVSA